MTWNSEGCVIELTTTTTQWIGPSMKCVPLIFVFSRYGISVMMPVSHSSRRCEGNFGQPRSLIGIFKITLYIP